MANTGMGMSRWVSPTPEDPAVRAALHKLQTEFVAAVGVRVRQRGLNPRTLLVTSPHDSVVCLTATSVVIAVSRGTATDAMSTDSFGDFTSQPGVRSEDLVRDSRRAFGWSDVASWVFDRSVFTDTAARKTAFDEAAEKLISELQQRVDLAAKLGIPEALTFLQNARARFESGSPAGYNDCKTNCRSALVSLVTGLSGKENTKEGIRGLSASGELGDRESEAIQAIERLLGSLKGLASKKGAHPPLSDEIDAAFTLRLTEATFDYLVRTVAVARGV